MELSSSPAGDHSWKIPVLIGLIRGEQVTTSVIGALKRGLGPLQNELGLFVCGGRGQHSRRTPDELDVLGNRRFSFVFEPCSSSPFE
jgi:hypothetical protein